MYSVLMLTLSTLLLILPHESISGYLNVYPKLKQFQLTDEEDVGAPLFLTPLIENGKIEEARAKALVQHKEMGDISSYSGYLTVNKTFNSNLFFWFFPAMHNPKTAPVILWLQGGPGATSMFGLFMENGPFIVTANKTLTMRKYSWNIAHNLIYIDNPVGTGYSFTDDERGYVKNETQVGKDILTALVQFFLLFPELQNNNFFVTGESYAGKYVPAVSYTINNYNVKAETKINLKGLSIGNGLCDPENQLLYSDYLYQLGLIDENGKTQFQVYENKGRELIKQKKYLEAFEIFDTLLNSDLNGTPSLFQNLTGFDYYFNYLFTKDGNDSDWMSEWIQKANVRHAIHVGNSTFHVETKTVEEHLKEDVMQSIVPLLTDLLQHYRVLIYNGQLDIIVAYPLTENYLKNLQWSGADKYKKTSRKIWMVGNKVAGYTKSVDNLTEVLIRNAGHMVPSDQPKWALDLITRFTHNKKF
ncbi:Venom serine carboxypeptidase [Trachymyrmex septentrionalis]|uniref:Carboxypeptidase n=1 Tax=Trachymyrmex septentrionalis TaxID=34720 RepID=A0A195F7F6_9HYME|nr:PREDICTED: venom serine carboxypeptidase [Trachymyrmex septentrionalis]KYN36373.1 Venom serine carboxypeptidase [Trachymyrmex septentrionalis]